VSGPAGEAAEVLEALERTKEAGPASCEYEWQFSFPDPRRSRRGGLIGWLGRRLEERLNRPMRGSGVVDVGARSAAIDFGGFAVVIREGREWSGRSGRLLSSLPSKSMRMYQPLWLSDLVTGVTEAREVGVERVGGRDCRHFSAVADAVVVATKTDFLLPSKRRLAALRAVPVDVWIDADGLIRRLRYPDHPVMVLDLQQHGVPAWDSPSLPTFRST
jgi:hypothetical protein